MPNVPAMLPLLRVTQAAIRVTAAGARLVGRIRRPNARRRPPAARVLLVLFVFLAVLPSVLPYDHLLPGARTGASEADEAAHASHCHVSPATCSDAPVTSGPGQLIFGVPLIVAPAMLAVLLPLAIPALAGITSRPEIRPPLASGHV